VTSTTQLEGMRILPADLWGGGKRGTGTLELMQDLAALESVSHASTQ
jgi:hypothetical protein